MARMKKVTVNEDGWSDLQFPQMDGYRMGCCDCGLVHDMLFEVHKITKTYDDGSFDTDPIEAENIRVAIKARRNNRSTAQVRRHQRSKP